MVSHFLAAESDEKTKHATRKHANRRPNKTNWLVSTMSHSIAMPPAGPLPRRNCDYRAVMTSLQSPSVMLPCHASVGLYKTLN